MPPVDERLIAPARGQLEAALRMAVQAVNQRGKNRQLAWPLPELPAFLDQFTTDAEGYRQWNGGSDFTATTPHGRSGVSRSVLAVAWWADAVGRKHVRILGKREQHKAAELLCLFWPSASGADSKWAPPPLVLVYPEFTFLRREGEQNGVVVTCRCGVGGRPGEVGWMGDCCGPCHDRREAGEVVPRLVEHFVLKTVGISLALAFSPDGTTLAIGNPAGVQFWDLASGQKQFTLSEAQEVRDIAFAAGGSALAIGNYHIVSIWEGMPTSAVPPSFTYSEGRYPVALSPDGSLFATGEREPLGAVVFPISPGKVSDKQPLWDAYVPGLGFSPDGKTLAGILYGERKGNETWAVRLWDTSGTQGPGRELPIGPHYQNATCLSFSPDSQTLAVGVNQEIELWDTKSGTKKGSLGEHRGRVRSVAFLPGGRWLVSAGEDDSTVRVWDLAAGREAGAFQWHQGRIFSFALSPDGRWLATGDGECVRLWAVDVLCG